MFGTTITRIFTILINTYLYYPFIRIIINCMNNTQNQANSNLPIHKTIDKDNQELYLDPYTMLLED